jgi:arginase family enzyme
MSERQSAVASDLAAVNGWDSEFTMFDGPDLPTYVGNPSFARLPWVESADEIRAIAADVAIVGAPFDDMVTHRPGTRFGPRAIREAQYTSGSMNSLQLDVRPFEELRVVDAGDANIVPTLPTRGHAMIFRKVREVAAAGAIPIVLGGDHSITWPSASAVADVRRPSRIGIVHFDAHADTAPGTARRCDGSSNPARSSARTSSRWACGAIGPHRPCSSGCASRASGGIS